MKFKGTKDKWFFNEKYQTIEDSQGYGIAQQNGIKNSENWINDALLISKAPEIFEMLKECIEYLRRADGTIYHNCADRAEIILTEATSQAE